MAVGLQDINQIFCPVENKAIVIVWPEDWSAMGGITAPRTSQVTLQLLCDVPIRLQILALRNFFCKGSLLKLFSPWWHSASQVQPVHRWGHVAILPTEFVNSKKRGKKIILNFTISRLFWICWIYVGNICSSNNTALESIIMDKIELCL